jgi:hypothetical protein
LEEALAKPEGFFALAGRQSVSQPAKLRTQFLTPDLRFTFHSSCHIIKWFSQTIE